MNIVRGLDRIFLVIAVISIPVSFMVSIGWVNYELKVEIPNPEYHEYKVYRGTDEWDEWFGNDSIVDYSMFRDEPEDDEWITIQEGSKTIKGGAEYHWAKVIVVSVFLSGITFYAVLFGLKLLLRSSINLSKWIADGFSDENK